MATAIALLASLALASQAGAETPAAEVRRAIAAVEGDSATVVETRWARRLARDSSDRLAALGLATLARYTYRDSLAERLYRSLVPAPGAAADLVSAHAYLGLAAMWRLHGQLARAESAFVSARAGARAAGDSALEAEALVWLSSVAYRARGPAAADAILDEAASLLPRDAVRPRALYHCGRAEVLVQSSRPGGREAAERGAALAAGGQEARVRASCLNIIAILHDQAGQVDSAIRAYEDVVAERRRARDRAGLAVALQRRAYLYRTKGWLGHARRDLDAALVESEVAYRAIVPWVYANFAYIGLSSGDLESGARYAALAAEQFAIRSDAYGAASMEALRGELAFAASDLPAARGRYEETVRRARGLGWRESEAASTIILAHIALAQGDVAAAERYLAEAERAARAGGLPAWLKTLTYHRGVVALRQGRFGRAEELFRRGLAAVIQEQPNWRYRYGARLAEVLAMTGRVAQAERELGAAADALDAWRESLDDRRLRLLAFQAREDDPDVDLGVATVLGALAAAGRYEAAFRLAERGRARDLVDRLNRAAALDPASGDAATRGAPGLAPAAVAAALPDSTALLEYVTGQGGEPTTLFLVTRAGTRAYRLPPQDSLEPAAARFHALLESGAEPRDLARALGSALLDRAVADLDATVTRLVVVPDGVLHRVPFDALVLADGRYALERFAVALAPAASVAVRSWSRPSSADPGRMLVIADPAFPGESRAAGESDATVFRDAVAGRGALPRLAATSREARVVARYGAAADVRRRRAATEAWLKHTPLDPYRVVHFATHALVDEGSLSNTALALTPGDGEDGFLGPGELAQLALSAELVVLSACRTAGGQVVRGEGVQGLAAPLLAAGARAVVATWWPIGDESTVRLVEDFYGALAAGRPAADALRAAKAAALGRGAPPSEWAAFTLVGDPLASPALRPAAAAAPGARWLLAAAGLLLAVTLAYGLSRRKRAT